MHNCVLLIWGFLIVSPVFSQSTEQVAHDTVYALPGIDVHTNRYAEFLEFMPARLTHISQAELSTTGARTLSEALVRSSPLFLRRYGAGLSSPSLRGSNSSQTLVLLDGIPLVDPQLGQTDFSLVPSALLQEISVLHGPGASLYGSNSLGGVVMLESRHLPDASVYAQATATAGPFRERGGELTLGARSRSVTGLFTLLHGGAEGDFTFTHPSLIPETTVRRRGADRTYTSLFAKADVRQKKGKTTLSFWHNHVERGLPGPSALPLRGERQWDRWSRWMLNHVQVFGTRTLSLRAGAHRASLRYKNPFLELDDTGNTTTFTIHSLYTSPLPESGGHWQVGAEGALGTATHPSLSTSAREWQSSLYAMSSYPLGRLTVLPSVRLDYFAFPDDKNLVALSPNLGVNMRPFPGAGLFVKAQGGKAFRKPTFNDRFWQPGGNPELAPEISWSYEAGISWRPERNQKNLGVLSEVTFFSNHIQDQISWQPTPRGYWAPGNVAHVSSRGIEASLEWQRSLSGDVNVGGQVIYVASESKDRSDRSAPSYGQPLRYTPDRLLKVRFSTEKVWSRLRVGIDLFTRYTGRRYVTTDGADYLEPYWIVDSQLRVSRRAPSVKITLQALIENTTDREYEVINGYPMPPRIVRIRLILEVPGI